MLGSTVSQDQNRLTREIILDFGVALSVKNITGKEDGLLPHKIYYLEESISHKGKRKGEPARKLTYVRAYVGWKIARTDLEKVVPSPEKRKKKVSAMASGVDESSDEDMADGGGGTGGTNDDGGYDGGFDE
jgi:hypothetical protein